MGSTLTNLIYHIVFSTKDRLPLITPELEVGLFPYIGGIIRGEKGVLSDIGGTADHVHLLCRFSPAIAVSDMLQHIKGNSSKWVNEGTRPSTPFGWQRGYAAFTVSESVAPRVAEYIRGQKEHHRKLTFKDEFLQLLQKHNVKYDERYIWD